MTNKNAVFLALIAASVLHTACGSSHKIGTTTSNTLPADDSGATASDSGATASGADAAAVCTPSPPTADCPVIVSDCNCNKDWRPFVFVHGTYGFGANFAHVAQILGSNGYCQDRIVGVEYNSVNIAAITGGGAGTMNTDPLIDAAIDKVLATARDSQGNPFTQVDLAGHSQGTFHCGSYLGNPDHAARVAHYINFSGTPAIGTVETLSLSSMHDLGGHPNHATGASVCTSDVGQPKAPAGCNVIQHTFKDQDHFAVAASNDSAIQVFTYLTGGAPKYKTVQCGDDPVTIEGIAETFADNTPVSGKIEVREVGETPRMGAVEQTITGDGDGHFMFKLKRNVAYEFAGYDASGTLLGFSYYTPFKRSSHLVRMLSPAFQADGSGIGGTIAQQSTGMASRDPNSSTVIGLWLGGAFRQDLGASLKVDTEKGPRTEVLTDGNAGATALTKNGLNGGVVGLYMGNEMMNNMTDLALAHSAAFQAFIDVYMPATTAGFINLSFTAGSEDPSVVGQTLKVSNWPSDKYLVNVWFQ
jgi:hypothetical protein